jgi:hypothetical protein
MWKLKDIEMPSTLIEARRMDKVPLWYMGKHFIILNKDREKNLVEMQTLWVFIKKYAMSPVMINNEMYVFDLALKYLTGDTPKEKDYVGEERIEWMG